MQTSEITNIHPKFVLTLNSPNTKQDYIRDVQQFLAWYGSSLSNLRPSVLLDYIAYLDEQYARSSIARKLSALREYIRFLVQIEKLDASIYSVVLSVKAPKIPKRVKRHLGLDEIEQLLDIPDLNTVPGCRDYAYMLLVLATGLRVSETTGICIEDIDFTDQSILIRGKGDKERRVYIDNDTQSAITYYLSLRGNPQLGPLFVNPKGDQISERYFQQFLKDAGEKAKIQHNVHPHKLRTTFAVDAINETADLDTLSKVLGHSDIRTTTLYTESATERSAPLFDSVQQRRRRARARYSERMVNAENKETRSYQQRKARKEVCVPTSQSEIFRS